MSLLADLLARIKQPASKREVPPNLRSIVQSSARQSGNRRKIILLTSIFTAAVVSGLLLTYWGRSLIDTESSVSLTVPARNASPDADRGTKQGGEVSQSAPEHQEGGPAEQAAALSITEVPDGEPEGAKAVEPVQMPGPVDLEPEPSQLEEEETQPSVAETDAADETVKQAPKGQESAPRKDAFLYSARKYEMNSEYLNALSSYKQALSLDSDNVAVMNNIAFVYLKMDLYAEAVAYARMALDRDGNYVPALINTAIAYAQSGSLHEAERFFNRAVELDQDNESVVLNLAVLHERQENLPAALRWYTHLGKLGNSGGRIGEARVYEKQGNREKAIELYRALSVSEAVEDAVRITARKRLMILMHKR